ncbi:PREDICTED: E3 ubiquitin-protein ligase MARCH8 [Tarenaya hassleriana]|uniref:E3 ubiquitin-protein ligase MARCH8 n=1 Tax=Tarenaya hassleriana TaxID=28532 RepID=UPI00053C57A2|nr:PREDICTED: E3 ubiquitin-protein ligase MARCH8 [Tarenaya hassleriana]
MSSLEVSHVDLENGTRDRRPRSDVSDEEEGSSCDEEFHSAVRSLCGESEIVDSDTEPSERECRICHMGLESSSHECGTPMVLGCSCKEDLGFVHKRCAEHWFKIKGNKTCEICRSIARNFSITDEIGHGNGAVGSEEEEEERAAAAASEEEGGRLWRGQRFLNFILTCMVSAFIISWFFHFNLPSQ